MKEAEDIDLKIEETDCDSENFLKFMDDWSEDIELYFSDFSVDDTTFATIYLLIVNNEPSGLFIYQDKGEELHIDVDYIVPKYRNLGIGRKFFDEKLETFKKSGYELLVSVSDNLTHQKYLETLGFKRSKMHDSRFELYIV